VVLVCLLSLEVPVVQHLLSSLEILVDQVVQVRLVHLSGPVLLVLLLDLVILEVQLHPVLLCFLFQHLVLEGPAVQLVLGLRLAQDHLFDLVVQPHQDHLLDLVLLVSLLLQLLLCFLVDQMGLSLQDHPVVPLGLVVLLLLGVLVIQFHLVALEVLLVQQVLFLQVVLVDLYLLVVQLGPVLLVFPGDHWVQADQAVPEDQLLLAYHVCLGFQMVLAVL